MRSTVRALRDRPFLTLDAAVLPTMAVNGVLFGPLGLYRSDGAGTIYVHEPSRLTLDVQDELAQRLADSSSTGPRLIAGTTLVDNPRSRSHRVRCSGRSSTPALGDYDSIAAAPRPNRRARPPSSKKWSRG